MKYYRKTENEYGAYINSAGIRYHVEWCSAVYSPTGQTPEDMGYEAAENQQEALTRWGLSEYVEPENLITE